MAQAWSTSGSLWVQPFINVPFKYIRQIRENGNIVLEE